mgnify:FL=1
MSFEAYIDNIHARTGKWPRDFFEEAVDQGVLRPDTKTMEFVNWLKASAGLGHGHAMAVWEAFRRNGWIPRSESRKASPGVRPAPAKPSPGKNGR